MTTSAPEILIDSPEDGFCEERGWVEATVTKEQACELIWPNAEAYGDPDGIPPDPARVIRIALAPAKDPATCDCEQQRWHPIPVLRIMAEQQDPADPEVEDLPAREREVREFWEVPVQ